MSENATPQSLRLKEFIDITGYSVFEFGKQCGIPSSKTMSDIIVKGKVPSPKVLDKIINRFPQLNHDWVVLGYGEMIVKGIRNQATDAHSLEKSQSATFENIQQNLINHDFAINELANMIQKALKSNSETLLAFHNKLAIYEENMAKLSNQISQSIDAGKETLKDSYLNYRHFMDKHRKTAVIQIKEALDTQDKKRWEYIKKADKKRETIANELMDKIDSNWTKYEAKIDKDLADFNEMLESSFANVKSDISNARADHLEMTNNLDIKRLKFLNDKFKEITNDIEKKSDANTKKALDFLLSIKKGTDEKADAVLGEFKKHTNPKPQR